MACGEERQGLRCEGGCGLSPEQPLDWEGGWFWAITRAHPEGALGVLAHSPFFLSGNIGGLGTFTPKLQEVSQSCQDTRFPSFRTSLLLQESP